VHAPWLLSLLANVSRYCPKLSVTEQDERLVAIGMV